MSKERTASLGFCTEHGQSHAFVQIIPNLAKGEHPLGTPIHNEP